MWSDVCLTDIDIDSKYLEQMKSYKYLGSIVSGANSIEEEIRERIALGNKAYYANKKKIFKREIVSRKAKLKLYWIVIRPVITYACRLWLLQESMKGKLLITERKILRIFGPAKDGDGTWRIKTNDELNNLVRKECN